jgi:hypothetical protein
LLCALVTMTTTSHFWMTTQMVTALVVTQQIEPWYHTMNASRSSLLCGSDYRYDLQTNWLRRLQARVYFMCLIKPVTINCGSTYDVRVEVRMTYV